MRLRENRQDGCGPKSEDFPYLIFHFSFVIGDEGYARPFRKGTCAPRVAEKSAF
jgi:hypothetical protein